MKLNNLRPEMLSDVVGQESVKERLEIIVKSSVKRDCTVPHVLFYGPAGTGKTTLALALSNEIGSNLISINAGNISTAKDILPSICRIKANDVVFIDEIHRLNIKTCETLYTIMEDFVYNMQDEEDIISVNIPKFTMIGATTNAGMLTKPMLDRFVYKMELSLYSNEHLSKMIKWMGEQLSISIDDSAAFNLAKRSRGTPRIANHLVRWARDYVSVRGSDSVCDAIVERAMSMIGVESDGTTHDDRAYMKVLKSSKRPMGLKSLVDATNIDKDTIENVIEPFLIQTNKITRTSKGRIIA